MPRSIRNEGHQTELFAFHVRSDMVAEVKRIAIARQLTASDIAREAWRFYLSSTLSDISQSRVEFSIREVFESERNARRQWESNLLVAPQQDQE